MPPKRRFIDVGPRVEILAGPDWLMPRIREPGDDERKKASDDDKKPDTREE